METYDSGISQEKLVGGIVTYVFVGSKEGEVADFGGETISNDFEGRVALFVRPSDGVLAAVSSVASDAERLFAGVVTGEYQPARAPEAIRRVQAIAATGQRGQVIVTMITRELMRTADAPDFEFHSLGTTQISTGANELLMLVEHPLLPLRQPLGEPQEPARRRNSFIGRARELDEVRRLLDSNRVVTIFGQSGLGKSALLSRLISEMDSDFSDGVAKLDLSSLAQAALVEPALIRLLEAPKLSGEDHLEALKVFLRPRRFLLVIDNAEHLLPEVRRIVAALVETCPDLAILIGSQRVLRLPVESRYRLEGLELPSIAEDWRFIQDYDAIALFVDRAQAVDIRFCLSSDNALDVAALCRRLDGIPLALELAASKTKALSPKQILGRLDEYRFDLLRDSDSSRPARHRTLEATVHWGYRSLREESRVLLRRLSVFLGAFTVDQAIHVCTDGLLSPDSVLAAFEELVDSSMLCPSSTSGSKKRFHLWETIRVYARDQLRISEETPVVQARHRQWCLEFTQMAEAGLNGREQSLWLAHLDASYEDVRSVIEWHLARRSGAATSIRMLLAIYPFFFARQCLHEGLRLTAKIVGTPSAANSPELARALNLASIFATRISDEESARRYAIGSVTEARRTHNVSMLARARNSLAFIAQDAGRFARARRHLLAALGAFRLLGEETNKAKLLINVAGLESVMGLTADARAHLEEVTSWFDSNQDPALYGMYLNNFSDILLAERLPLRALKYVEQSITLHSELRDVQGLAISLRNCAYAYESLGYFTQTALLIGASKRLGKQLEQHLFDFEAEAFRGLVWRTTEALGPEEFTALTLEGSHLTETEILDQLRKHLMHFSSK